MGADPRHARHEALVRALEAEGLDGVLVTSRANIRYLTGFSGSAALVAATRADLLLVTDFRYDEQARAEAAAVARVEIESTSVWERLFKELATLGSLVAVGYEAHALTVKDAERLTEGGKPWRWKPTTELVERLRGRKDAGGVAAVQSAAVLGGRAGDRAAAESVRAGGGGAAAGARGRAGGDGRARGGCPGARPDRGAGFRRRIRTLTGPRHRTRGARGAAAREDQRRSPACGRRRDDRAGCVPRGPGRRADRGRRAPGGRGTRTALGRTQRARRAGLTDTFTR